MEYHAVLSKPYIRVCRPEGMSFGGSQEWFPDRTIRDYGCGLIGASDVLLYIGCGEAKDSENPFIKEPEMVKGQETAKIPSNIFRAEDYERLVKMYRRYFPILPGFGMPGWFLSIGFNLWFRRHGFLWKARWGVPYKKMMESVAGMLEENLPVILSVGPHFPCFWRKEGLLLYQKEAGHHLKPSVRTRAHYVVVTAVCGEWLQISSWGREYYIRISEYGEYVRKYSCPLFSNICLIRRRRSSVLFRGPV